MGDPGTHWLVDGMNVIGSRPDGWWRDRRGAMRRLAGRLAGWAADTGQAVTLVLDGAPFELEAGHPLLEVAFAPRRGPDAADDEIVRRLEAEPERALVGVVTSDAGLAGRVRSLGVRVAPAGWLLGELERAPGG